MRIDVAKYLRLRIAPVLYKRAVADRALKEKIAVAAEGPPACGRHDGNDTGLKNSGKRYSFRRFFLVVALSCAVCGVCVASLVLFFPKLQPKEISWIGPGLYAVLLSPIVYAFLYRPMIMQSDKWRMAAARMRDLAHIDVLTGLYNRRGFLAYAARLLKLSDRTKKGLILVYADVNNMKRINDDYGHEEGDRALVAAGHVLERTFRSSDVMARVGGDEFAVLALEAKEENPAAWRARLNENLKNDAYNVNAVHKLTLSSGVLYYDPQNPQTIENMLKKADLSMYAEKAA